jgi:3-hydroxyacyl-CoA dehydrogenase/enoyl-CoA hydratase/3-hydroxybutyryl-CoA epimerase
MNLTNFRFETDAGGIALLTWDMAGRSMNVITPQVIDEIEHVIDHVVASAAIKGYTATSGQKLIFFDLRNADSPCPGSMSL